VRGPKTLSEGGEADRRVLGGLSVMGVTLHCAMCGEEESVFQGLGPNAVYKVEQKGKFANRFVAVGERARCDTRAEQRKNCRPRRASPRGACIKKSHTKK